MADKEVAIRINDIHKEFILPQSKNTSVKQAAVNIVRRNNKVTQKVLDGVSFDINKGDFFGIVGRNGSGKSTLLKLIAGVYYPTSGNIEVNGGLTPFIELGVGFNPELSGRDNVYLNGALLGFTRAQMNQMYDEIVDFAELGPFMDQKLKNYSSGMQVRLAFSIAIKAKNDVLIFDEVLAVGDEAFQQKCLNIFEKYKRSGQTVILVTHDMDTVRKFCTKAALISGGKLVDIGNPRKIADEYTRLNQLEIDNESDRTSKNALTNFDAISLDVQTRSVKGRRTSRFDGGETICLALSWQPRTEVDSFVVNIFRNSGEHITGIRVWARNGISTAKIDFKPLLSPGTYYFLIEVRDSTDKASFGSFEGAQFHINSNVVDRVPGWSGLTYIDHEIYKN